MDGRSVERVRTAAAKGGQVKNIYYVVLLAYCLWGLLALRLTPNPLVLAIVSSVCGNVGLGSSALHTLFVNRRLMPPELRLPWYMQLGLVVPSFSSWGSRVWHCIST